MVEELVQTHPPPMQVSTDPRALHATKHSCTSTFSVDLMICTARRRVPRVAGTERLHMGLYPQKSVLAGHPQRTEFLVCRGWGSGVEVLGVRCVEFGCQV